LMKPSNSRASRASTGDPMVVSTRLGILPLMPLAAARGADRRSAWSLPSTSLQFWWGSPLGFVRGGAAGPGTFWCWGHFHNVTEGIGITHPC
jgi:hypothetical protein